MMKRSAVFGFTLLLLLGGCAGKTLVESDLGIKGAPDWVNEGTQVLNDRDGRLFHGVGQAPPMGDLSLQKSTADNRARAEVARILSSFIDVVSKDFGDASGTDGEMIARQTVSRQIESLTKTNLSGARIIGHWRDQKTGTIYAVAELDLERVKQVLAVSQELNQSFGSYLQKRGDTIFDRQLEKTK